jgi:hypothetical protein
MAALIGLVFGWAADYFFHPVHHSQVKELEARVAKLKPQLVIVLSGKRKSGKDFIAERLQAEFVNMPAMK